MFNRQIVKKMQIFSAAALVDQINKENPDDNNYVTFTSSRKYHNLKLTKLKV